ncbi:ABI gene family member 3 isoform X2 [Petaurus breviceps papuanus]|uniref:ABI gene family member 3 isoform X2 n=1 Tax=Petaurus breviceps papuanus TaxID=3040969 RepID=UPI0036D93C6D
MAELQQLLEFEIPEGREALRSNHSSLLRVADYCESNYVQATEKRKALEETMAFTTQALASVSYQINNLAGHLLRMLDLQDAGLRQVEASVSTLDQMVNMHIEKVGRREIGTLAVFQRLPTNQKIIPPENLPSFEPYYRKPLNFACLDNVGHGIKDLSTQLSRTGTLSRKSIKAAVVPTSGTLCRVPRIPEPVHLPVIPDDKVSAASSLTSTGTEGICGFPVANVPVMPQAPPLPGSMSPSTEALEKSLPEELSTPQPATDLPPSLDLPPPLETDELGLPPPPPPDFDLEEPTWAPAQYLEKVVTLYPYTCQKDNELSFDVGTTICVTRRYSDGWCEGVTSEGSGFFPGNYVEPSC